MSIGDIAKVTGTSARMIRHSEDAGLIRPATPALSGYRVFSDKDLQTLHFVRDACDLGYMIRQSNDRPTHRRDHTRASASVKEIAMGHLATPEKTMWDLKDMSDTLPHSASHCHSDGRPDRPILKTLGSAEAVAPLPKTRDRRRTRSFDRVR